MMLSICQNFLADVFKSVSYSFLQRISIDNFYQANSLIEG